MLKLIDIGDDCSQETKKSLKSEILNQLKQSVKNIDNNSSPKDWNNERANFNKTGPF